VMSNYPDCEVRILGEVCLMPGEMVMSPLRALTSVGEEDWLRGLNIDRGMSPPREVTTIYIYSDTQKLGNSLFRSI